MHANTQSLVPNGAVSVMRYFAFLETTKGLILVAKTLRAALRKVVLKWKSVSVTGANVPFV